MSSRTGPAGEVNYFQRTEIFVVIIQIGSPNPANGRLPHRLRQAPQETIVNEPTGYDKNGAAKRHKTDPRATERFAQCATT